MPQINHPDYDYMKLLRYRSIKNGGLDFIYRYLTRFSRESQHDFDHRISFTYNPAMAMACIKEISNALTTKTGEVRRHTNIESYNTRSKNNIDNRFNSITQFFNLNVIDELLCMGKVGIYVDRADSPISTKDDTIRNHPYIYTYKAEDITSWRTDNFYNLISVQLKSKEDVIQDGLVAGRKDVLKTFRLTDSGVVVTIESDNNSSIKTINLKAIPLVILELNHSLLKDIDLAQIALLNLSSSDIAYLREANITTYVENYDATTDLLKYGLSKRMDEDGVVENKNEEVVLGSLKGRRYPKGLNAPQYIAPPTDPAKLNMEKQEQIKKEMRQMLALSINNLRSNSASLENRQIDKEEKETGLNVIGNELYRADKQIVEFWADYMGIKAEYSFEYPTNWAVISEEEKISKSKDLISILPSIPSVTFQKEIAKKINYTLLSDSPPSILEKINKEIDNSIVVVTDPKVIGLDIEAGLVGIDTASKLRGYPEGETEKAKKDHAERLLRIAISQTPKDMGPRGISDLETDPNSSREEKKKAHDKTEMDVPKDTTRGEGK